MGTLGWGAGLPLEVGGDTSRTDAVYRALRGAVGKGGSGPPDSLEDLWRQSKAQTIASVVIMNERAVLQAFPNVATDRIAAYERLLRFGAPSGATDEARREAISAAWTAESVSAVPDLATSLTAIDPALTVETLDTAIGALCEFGKMFPARGSESLGVSAYPNFADDFIVRVHYAPGAGQTAPPAASTANAATALNTALPSWVDFVIVTGDGFFCDGGLDGTSLLDLKSLGV